MQGRITLLIMVLPIIVLAQITDTMNVKLKTGTTIQFPVSSINLLSFSGSQGKDTLHIILKSGITNKYLITTINKINFSNIQPNDSLLIESITGVSKIYSISSLSELLFINTTLPVSPQIVNFSFNPRVVKYDRSEPVLFEVKVSGTPTKVVFEYNGSDINMKDDGLTGDRIAGDSIYTISFQPSQITNKLSATYVNKPFIGYCKTYFGTSLITKFNVFADVLTSSIPIAEIYKHNDEAQSAKNIINFIGNISPINFDAKPWLKKLYGLYNDDYDFVNIVLMPSTINNRYHFSVKNSVQGIGLSLLDNTTQYGSSGKLQGITVFPNSSMFDGAENGYQHELAHQWINFLNNTALQSGIPHWPMSDLANGVMGMSIGATGVGGQFPYKLVQEGNNYRATYDQSLLIPSFNDLELYLIGLMPPDSVKSHFVFDNQNQTVQNGGILYGPVTNITIDNLVSVLGQRTPSYTNSQKVFKIATIIISEKLLSSDEMSFYDYFAGRAGLTTTSSFSSGFLTGIAKPFYISTGGRGQLDPALKEKLVQLPAPPKLSLPTNKSKVTTSIVVKWEQASWADTYQLQVSSDSSFSSTIVNNSNLTSTSFNLINLTKDMKYFWRVKSNNNGGSSSWSEVWSFSTSSTLSTTYNLPKGWSLVSLPFQTLDSTKNTLFPNAVSELFSYENGYRSNSFLNKSKGYWVKHAENKINEIFGTAFIERSIPINLGWNLIGPYESNLSVSNVTTSPANILVSNFFGYDNGYFIPTSLESGKGYWIKAKQNGAINIPSAVSKTTQQVLSIIDNKWFKIITSDALGKVSTLYFSIENLITNSFELPPLPPNGIFDVRWSNDMIVESLDGPGEIIISSAKYPVTISVDGGDVRIRDKINGKIINQILKSGQTLTITNESINRLEVSRVEIPVKFEMYQNYPNPFNPATKIKFALPERGITKLTIYNTLGEKITDLLNQELDAGYHEVEWNASKYGSGVYFIQLISNNNSLIKKMLLMK